MTNEMKSERTKSQRSAEARYDAKRKGKPSLGRATTGQVAWIDERRQPGESRAAAIMRMLGISHM